MEQPAELTAAFTARVEAALAECHSLGYHPHDFESMLRSMGAVALAKRLVVSGIQSGLLKLKKMNRLDLSIENIMLDPIFAPLFTAKELEAATWRLNMMLKG